MAWTLAGVLAVHLLIYYSITAWLPTFLVERDGMTPTHAGLIASVFQMMALAGAFGVPLLARRLSLAWILMAMGGLWIITPVWMLLAPMQWPGWSLAGGIAQGGTFVVVFMLIMRSAHDLDENRHLSAFVQGVAYSVAAAGPLVTGWMHQTTGRWTVAFVFLSAMACLIAVAGMGLLRRHAGKVPV